SDRQGRSDVSNTLVRVPVPIHRVAGSVLDDLLRLAVRNLLDRHDIAERQLNPLGDGKALHFSTFSFGGFSIPLSLQYTPGRRRYCNAWKSHKISSSCDSGSPAKHAAGLTGGNAISMAFGMSLCRGKPLDKETT